MYKDETLYLEMKAKQMALPSIEQQVPPNVVNLLVS